METPWRCSVILGKEMLLPSEVPSQLYLAHSCGGACARGAVGGSRQIASRTIRTRIDLGRRGREDFFAAGRPQWCVPCLVLDGRPGAQCDVLLPGWPTAGYNFRGNGWERDMLFIWVVRESEGRRKLRTAARSPASTMSCGRRTGVGSGNVNRAAHFGGLMTLSASSFRPKGAGSWRSALSMGIMT